MRLSAAASGGVAKAEGGTSEGGSPQWGASRPASSRPSPETAVALCTSGSTPGLLLHTEGFRHTHTVLTHTPASMMRPVSIRR
jgi:hypothetical protein